MNAIKQKDFLQPNSMSAQTPTNPAPSPEAVAAAVAVITSLCGEETAKEISGLSSEIIHKHFAPIIAKAELCDRLAAALDTIDSQVRGALNNAQPEEAPDILDHVGNIARVAHREYEATRAAGPADAGGRRGYNNS